MNSTDPNHGGLPDTVPAQLEMLTDEQKQFAKMLGRVLAQRWQELQEGMPKDSQAKDELT